jgi:hypothetical protein
MNERIEKLTVQAEEWVCKNYPDAMDDNDEFHAQTMSKFAELIVKECIGIIAKRKDQAIDDSWNVDEAMSMAEMDLEEHFGVKE